MKIVVLVGPPGSGKSTYCKELQDQGYIRVSQDDQGKHGHHQIFGDALRGGKDMVIDRMGFSKEQRNRYLNPAKEAGYETKIVVLHQPYVVCKARMAARLDHPTIKDEISASAALNLFFGKYERVEDSEANEVVRIWPKPMFGNAIICDLDGTLCNIDHRLHYVKRAQGERKDWKSFFDFLSQDSVNQWCADILKSMSKNTTIVYCSGRPDNHREPTVKWLKDNDLYAFEGPNYDFHLYMRPRNDSREDSIVKEIILDFEILTRFVPSFMIDDRGRVVEMWRKRGFVCLQCAPGNF